MISDSELLRRYVAGDQTALTQPAAGSQVMSEQPGAHAPGFPEALASDPSYRTLHTQNR